MTYNKWLTKNVNRPDIVGEFSVYVMSTESDDNIKSKPPRHDTGITSWIQFLNENEAHLWYACGLLISYIEWMNVSVITPQMVEDWDFCAKQVLDTANQLWMLLGKMRESHTQEYDIEKKFLEAVVSDLRPVILRIETEYSKRHGYKWSYKIA